MNYILRQRSLLMNQINFLSRTKGIYEQMEEQSVEIKTKRKDSVCCMLYAVAAGDSVFVTNGPFKDFDGKFISAGRGRAMQVELDVFGRLTVVEIDDTALDKK